MKCISARDYAILQIIRRGPGASGGEICDDDEGRDLIARGLIVLRQEQQVGWRWKVDPVITSMGKDAMRCYEVLHVRVML